MRRSLEGIDGVVEAEVVWKRGYARVVTASTVTDEALVEAVGKSGRFTGKVISREPAEAGER